MENDYDLSETIYNFVLRYNKINQKELSPKESNFIYEQCEDMDREVFDFITDQKEVLEEWKKDQAYSEDDSSNVHNANRGDDDES